LEHKSFATRKNMGMDEKDLIIYTERKIVAWMIKVIQNTILKIT
jgi:hypothetical protein